MTKDPSPTGSPPDIPVEHFLRHFPGHWIQYFDDGPLNDKRKAMATPQFDPAEARRKQRAGCGVFFSPNAFDGVRRAENLLRVQAAYVDIDLRHEGDGTPDGDFERRLESGLAALLGFPLPPHVVVRTKNGVQAIWRTEPLPPGEGLDLFRETVDRLVSYFRADPAARDVTRVLRLPGFLHLKDPASPFLCDSIRADLEREPYPMAALLAAARSPGDHPPLPPVVTTFALRLESQNANGGVRRQAPGARSIHVCPPVIAGRLAQHVLVAMAGSGRAMTGLDAGVRLSDGWYQTR